MHEELYDTVQCTQKCLIGWWEFHINTKKGLINLTGIVIGKSVIIICLCVYPDLDTVSILTFLPDPDPQHKLQCNHAQHLIL